MSGKYFIRILILAIIVVGSCLFAAPYFDLGVSHFFYVRGVGFPARLAEPFTGFSSALRHLSWALAIILSALIVLCCIRRRPIFAVPMRGWLFLLLGLVLMPGLLANTLMKDHWGRARPYQITEFGGAAHFSRPLLFADQCKANCSFVSGDGAFGFYLPSFAYLPQKRRSRQALFWGGMAFGCLAGANRIVMGAHFLSDVFFAAIFMLAGCALLHIALFGFGKTRACWRDFLCRRP